MDLAVLITGLAVSVCQALGREGTHVFIASLEDMAGRPNLKPAEAEIFRNDASNQSIHPYPSLHPPIGKRGPCLPPLKSGVPVKIFLPVTACSYPRGSREPDRQRPASAELGRLVCRNSHMAACHARQTGAHFAHHFS